jgi:chaperone modulatory protein CbpM
MNASIEILQGTVVDEDKPLSLTELCTSCSLSAETVDIFIEHGIVETLSASGGGQFSRNSVLRVQTVLRLQRDLNVNIEGAALVLDLLDEIRLLRQVVASAKRYEHNE